MKGVVNPSAQDSKRLCLCDDEARAHSPQPPTLEDHGLRSSLPLKGPPLTVMAHSPQPPTLGYLHCRIDDYGGGKFTKKRKILVADDDALKKEIRIERRDEYGRIMILKEAFRALSHKLHGKGPGKRAQEKRKKLHEEESRSKQSQFNTDKPSLFMGRMLELQAQSNKPYIILHSGNS
ncbi:hypothetical protein Acr_06g0008650 [Actinidia rufa]|uniref:Uncharacterized protein n=1 Tax=Actinidia rufa TaxID=165716 RepID=A0A7J0ER17_9ERIC|nr:hypothetical protein Acr_06g0008650 [Actinidia rufa]